MPFGVDVNFWQTCPWLFLSEVLEDDEVVTRRALQWAEEIRISKLLGDRKSGSPSAPTASKIPSYNHIVRRKAAQTRLTASARPYATATHLFLVKIGVRSAEKWKNCDRGVPLLVSPKRQDYRRMFMSEASQNSTANCSLSCASVLERFEHGLWHVRFKCLPEADSLSML